MSKRSKLPPSQRRQKELVKRAEAMSSAIRSACPDMPGESALIACTRTGLLEGRPDGYRVELAECVLCGHAPWITSSVKEAVESKGMTVKCVCYSDCDWKP
jgi:hypothetical protein